MTALSEDATMILLGVRCGGYWEPDDLPAEEDEPTEDAQSFDNLVQHTPAYQPIPGVDEPTEEEEDEMREALVTASAVGVNCFSVGSMGVPGGNMSFMPLPL